MEAQWPLSSTLACGTAASAALALLSYLYLTWPYDTFKKLGLRGPKPLPLFGNTLDVFKRSVAEIDVENAKLYGKVYGEFNGRTPLLFVGDPDMVKDVLIKEFSCFHNRTSFKSLQQKPLDRMLTVARDDHWKHMRALLSPVYTSGKLKQMLAAISECADNLVAHIDKQAEPTHNAKDLFSGFTMDVISATAFGLDTKSLEQPDHPFLKHAKEFFSFIAPGNVKKMVAFAAAVVSHSLSLTLRRFGFTIIDPAAEAYMEGVIRGAMAIESNENAHQNLVRLCRELVVDITEVSKDSVKKTQDGTVWTTQGLTMDDVISNSIVFLLAGYDTVSTFITFFCYAMATNPTEQEKVFNEIKSIIQNGDVTYEKLKDLSYFDMCMDESLRMYPSSLRLDRACNKATTIGGVHISPGMSVIIPVYAIHHDPDYWNDPYTFTPLRFSKENRAAIHPFAYLPFGAGPRTCIGMRLALLEAKVALVKLLSKYEICACETTPSPPIKLTKSFGLLVSAEPMMLSFKKREKSDA